MLTAFERIEQFLKSDIFLAFAGIVLLMALVFWVLKMVRPGPAKPLRFSEKSWLNALTWFGLLLLPILAALFVEVLWLLIKVVAKTGEEIDSSDLGEGLDLRWYALAIVGLLTALGGLLGTPLAFIRVHTTERQTVAQEQGLITDRINKAVENLGATRVVKRPTTPARAERMAVVGSAVSDVQRRLKEGPEHMVFVDAHEPNLEVRIGAIYALERIAQDSLRDHVQIMEILTAYVRENAKAEDAEPSARDVFEDALGNGTADKSFLNDPTAPADMEEAQSEWLRALAPLRTDIQTALTVIGRRNAGQKAAEEADTRQSDGGYRLDLRNTRLQKADISNLDFSKALLTGARLEGATLVEALLESTDLGGARLERATLREARLEAANLRAARLEGANLNAARLKKANLSEARLEGANLFVARLEAAHLNEARLEGADLTGARVGGAYLGQARVEGANLRGAQLQAANLRETRLEGAFFYGTRMDSTTDLRDAITGCAAVKWVDFTDVALESSQAESMFGDGSVTLPDTMPRPDHWPSADLEWSDFHEEWTRWKSDPVTYILPQDRPKKPAD